MNGKNIFKQKVIQQAVLRGIKHPEATQEVEKSFRFYPAREERVFEHCGDPNCFCGNHLRTEYSAESYRAKVGDWSFGGDAMGQFQMWPTATGA